MEAKQSFQQMILEELDIHVKKFIQKLTGYGSYTTIESLKILKYLEENKRKIFTILRGREIFLR